MARRQPGELHQVALQSGLELGGTMYGDGKPNAGSWPCVDMVTAIDANQGPTLGFDQLGQFLARKGCHKASSIT